ncbi:hypothetical protein [Microbacterium testaceum]|uniref:hypothetical protein n=1 Tax=Microbacterium testaceum TaxID=2033 RepID=UPI00115FCF05|nr:hypothetical protein [Microbacterium testaceum]
MAKRLSTVEKHPQLARINQAIDDGVSYRDISSLFGLSLAATGRYALSRKSELAKVFADEVSVTDVILRALEAADHARDVRRQSRHGSSPLVQSRAIRAELDALSRLGDHLGIDDTAIADHLAEGADLVQMVVAHLRDDETARQLLDRMERSPRFANDARAIREALATSTPGANS